MNTTSVSLLYVIYWQLYNKAFHWLKILYLPVGADSQIMCTWIFRSVKKNGWHTKWHWKLKRFCRVFIVILGCVKLLGFSLVFSFVMLISLFDYYIYLLPRFDQFNSFVIPLYWNRPLTITPLYNVCTFSVFATLKITPSLV